MGIRATKYFRKLRWLWTPPYPAYQNSRRCWTRLAKRAGRNFRSSSFSSDRQRTNISASRRWCGNSIGGSLAFDGEGILEWHILTKYFADRRKAVDVFYSIHKAAIVNAEQLIQFRNHSFAVRRIFTVERKIISVSDFFEIDLISLSSFDASTCVWSTSVYRSTPREPVKKRTVE